jgi:hypothetical protein
MAVFGVVVHFDLNQGTSETTHGTYYAIVEIGPYMVIVGGIVAVIGSFLGLGRQRSTAGRS